MGTESAPDQLRVTGAVAFRLVPLIAVQFDHEPAIQEKVDSTISAGRG